MRLGVIAWVLLCLLLLFCGAMTRSITYDEDQYLAAGVLTRTLLPYRDFAYLQPPLYPFVLAPLMAVASSWRLHALTPATLGSAFDADPPAAIYTGLYADAWTMSMDASLAAYAEQHHWLLVRTDALGGHLWVRPRA